MHIDARDSYSSNIILSLCLLLMLLLLPTSNTTITVTANIVPRNANFASLPAYFHMRTALLQSSLEELSLLEFILKASEGIFKKQGLQILSPPTSIMNDPRNTLYSQR